MPGRTTRWTQPGLWGLVLVLVVGQSWPHVSAQQQQRPQGQIPDLGRPTESGDEVPRFDYDAYFPGTWEFEWRTPESPLSSGGMVEGTETFSTSEDGRSYTSRIDAEGPDGPFTTESTIIYLREQRTFSRYERDTRGFEMLKVGRIGGDLGGFYTVHYETAPFITKGQEIRLRLTTRLVSPLNYKVEARISVDGGPFTNFGTGWWQKRLEEVATR